MEKRIILWLMTLSFLTQSALAYEIEVLERDSDRVPKFALSKDKIILQSFTAREIKIIDKKNLKSQTLNIAQNGGNVSLTADQSGNVGICNELGQTLIKFNLNNPSHFQQIDLSKTQYNCAGLFMNAVNDKAELWFTSLGNQSIVQTNASYNFKIKKVLNNISGPLELKISEDYLFSINGTVLNRFKGMPLVIDIKTGQTLLGNAMGDQNQTPFSREYSDQFLVDDLARIALYPRPTKNDLLMLSFDKLTDLQFIKVKASNPVEVHKFNNCYLVLGKTLDQSSGQELAEFSVLKIKNEDSNIIEEIDTLKFSSVDELLNSARRFEIENNGDIYFSGIGFLARVKKIIDPARCL